MSSIEFTFDESIYYGEGLVGVPFVSIIDASYVYYIFKSDYLTMEAPPQYVTDHNKHYYEAETSNEVKVEGVLEFTFNYKSYEKDSNICELVSDICVNELQSIDIYMEEYLLITREFDQGLLPVANISRKNFVNYTLLDNNSMQIQHRQKNPETNAWSIDTITFEIKPHNEHMLRVKEW